MKDHVSPRLQREHVHCPITALELLRITPDGSPYVLSGEDTHLKIYDADTQRLCASVQVFAAQPIHGISLGGGCTADGDGNGDADRADVLIWGGASVTVLSRAHIRDLIISGGGVDHDDEDDDDDGDDDMLLPPVQAVVQAPDWIYHGAISPTRPDLAAVVTAHNEVIPLHIAERPERGRGRGRRALRLGRLRALPSRPILYSAQVRWTGDEGGVLVAAGTVFGEIIVWRCRVDGDGNGDGADEERVEVLFVFTGHEGSIFGVDISPELVVHPGTGTGTGKAVRLLASCSDDRTVRVWDISDTEVRRQRLAAVRGVTEARETGFGENASAPTGLGDAGADDQHRSPKPLAMAMGHGSRIWNVRFSPESARYSSPGRTAESLALYSFGEDATAQRWRLDLGDKHRQALSTEPPRSDGMAEDEAGEVAPAATLTNETMSHNHSGKHIWSSALLWPMSSTSQDKTLIATGGSDGKIHLTEEYSVATNEHRQSSVITVSSEDISSKPGDVTCPSAVEDGKPDDKDHTFQQEDTDIGNAIGEPFHMYTLLSGTYGLATTASGRLFNGSLTGSEMNWTEVPLPQSVRDDLARYQTVRSAGPKTVLLGSPNGQLYLCHGGKVDPILKLSRKIADIFCLPVESFRGLVFVDPKLFQPTTVPVAVTTMGSSQVRLLLLKPDSADMITYDIVVELEKGFIVTAVGCCKEYLIFGSRIGVLLVHKWNAEQGCFQQVSRLNRPGSKDAVSSIIALPPKRGEPSPYFLTTARDGRYRIYEITNQPTTDITVHLRHEAIPPLGPMIEAAFFTKPAATAPDTTRPELVLCGFRSKDFIVWNETRQQELANVECGGGHRAFTYHINHADPEQVAFIWTKASRTCVHSQGAVAQRTLKGGGHGREVKAAASWGQYLATGAEDTDIRIWRHGEGKLSCLAVIEKHTTGIQCLKWAGEKYLISSSGNEELAVWRVTRLDQSDYEGFAVSCEGMYPDKTRGGDLRIMSFDVEVMETVQGGEAEEVLCLSLVLSNSTLKTYRYSKTDGFTLLAEGRYTGACMMQIRHLRVAVDEDGSCEAHVLTSSTDGHVAIWKMSTNAASTAPPETAAYALVEVSRLHQSSIKALDLRTTRTPRHTGQSTPTTQSPIIVVTGGDDNAIGHVHLEWAGGHFRAAARSLTNGAHAAAITGLCITGVDVEGGDSDDDDDDAPYRVEVCTSSTDQRVKTWRMTIGRHGGVKKMALVANRYSAIADCGDLESLGEGAKKVVVAGVGMEIWRV